MLRNATHYAAPALDLKSLLKALKDVGGRSNDGAVDELLTRAEPSARQKVFSGSGGGDLALHLSRLSVAADHPRDASSLRAVLQNDYDAKSVNTKGGHRFFKSNGATLDNATFVLSAENLRGDIADGRLPNIARELLLARELSLDDYPHREQLTFDDYGEMLGSGRVTFNQLRPHLAGMSDEMVNGLAFRSMLAGRMTYADFRTHYELEPEQIYPALQGGVVRAVDYLREPGVSGLLTFDFIEEGLLSLKDAMSLHPLMRLDSVKPLVDGGHATWAEWLQNGEIAGTDMTAAVEQGLFTVEHAKLSGRNQYALVHLLHEAGKLTKGEATYYGTLAWQPEQSMSPALLSNIFAFPSEATLLESLALPGPVGDARNKPFLMRALAMWLTRPETIEAPPHKGEPEPDACFACMEDFDDLSKPFKLDACDHPATMDVGCFLEGLQAAGQWQCPDAKCARPINPNEVLHIGFDAKRADASAVKIVGDKRAGRENFYKCKTEDCANGVEVKPGNKYTLDCRCCGTATPIVAAAPSVGNLSHEDGEQVRLLIKHAKLATNGDSFCGTNEMVIRECYHCGYQTEHVEYCYLLTCKGCKKQWDFVKGPTTPHTGWGDGVEHNFKFGPQSYVPKKGWMVSLGLYEGLTPGAKGVVVWPTLEKNLARLEAAGRKAAP